MSGKLEAAGLSRAEALQKEVLFARCTAALDALDARGGLATRNALHTLDPLTGSRPVVAPERTAFFVPGRIEVLGKHTDYAGGRSIVCAVERGFIVVAVARADAEVRLIDASSGDTFVCPMDVDVGSGSGWEMYASTVVRRVARNFPAARTGCDIAFASDLPPASGLSSSSALVVAIFLAMRSVNSLADGVEYRSSIASATDLAGYLAAVENGQTFRRLAGDFALGVFGGSEDHTAILCSQAGMLTQYSFCPVRTESVVAVPEEYVFVIAYSGVASEKAGNAKLRYNEVSLAARRLLEMWNETTRSDDQSLADVAARGAAEAQRMREIINVSNPADMTRSRLSERFEQFVLESEHIVPRAMRALEEGDIGMFGRLVDQSQSAAEHQLRNQVPETAALARTARLCGAAAASAFGGGFGGSVWALVRSSGVEEFADQWESAYRETFPAAAGRSVFFVTRPGPAAMQM